MIAKQGLVLCLMATAIGCGQAAKTPPLPSSENKGPRISLEVHVSETQPSKDAVETMKAELAGQMRECGLSRIAPDLEKLVEPSIRIRTERADDQRLEVGISKMGGAPDLPETTEWPRWKGAPLAFIAQLKMADVAKYDLTGSLPHSGLLSLFYHAQQETWGFDPNDRGSWRVLFFDDDQPKLRRVRLPTDLPKEGRFKPCKLAFSTELTLPPWESLYLERLGLTQQETDAYVDLLQRISGEDEFIHRLLGHPDPIQGDMQLECQLTFHGLYTGNAAGYEDQRRKELEKGATDWQLLLQIDSDEDNAGMMWGDAGRLYFWIRRDDLKKRAFENVWLVLQCY
jgi:uncharacterized protein YwqG